MSSSTLGKLWRSGDRAGRIAGPGRGFTRQAPFAMVAALLLFGCGSSTNSGAGGAGGSGNSGSSAGGSGNSNTGGAGGSAGNGGGAGGSTGNGGASGSASGGSGGSGGSGSGGSGGSGGASTAGGGTLCPGLGWCILPDTKLRSVCPSDPAVQGYEGCAAVINDWSGGAADVANNRLLVWGGGHHGYFGNEVYALDLSDLTMKRLNDPSDPSNVSSCPETYPDGTPSARHTYDGLVYIPDTNQMYAYGGSKADCGYMTDSTWRLDLSSMSWKHDQPKINDSKGCGTPFAGPGAMADYDPQTHSIYMDDLRCLWRFDAKTATYTSLNGSGGPIDYHLSGVIDPVHRMFVMIGNGEVHAAQLDAANHPATSWSLSGCDGLVKAPYPGLAYDPVQDRVVGWAGGNTIYLLDTTTRKCSTVNYTGGPAKQAQNGTYGRFRYFPKLGVFGLVNDVDTDSYTLRLTK